MSEIDFYNEENKVSGTFFDFKEIGDSIEGTLTGVSEKDDNFHPGEKQKVYEIERTSDGSIALIGGRPVIDPQMKNIRLGQIIAIKFEATKPSKVQGYKPTKLIQVYAPKNAERNGPLMNQAWINGQSEANLAEQSVLRGSTPSAPVQTPADPSGFKESEDGEITIENLDFSTTPTPAPVAPVAPAVEVDPNKAALDEIKALAIDKLKTTEDMAFAKVMETTGLAIIAPNFEKIKAQLNAIG